jgi:hypothetical protein
MNLPLPYRSDDLKMPHVISFHEFDYASNYVSHQDVVVNDKPTEINEPLALKGFPHDRHCYFIACVMPNHEQPHSHPLLRSWCSLASLRSGGRQGNRGQEFETPWRQ